MYTPDTVYDSNSIYFFRTSMTHCSYCNAPLFISYHTNVKTIKTLKGNIKAKHVVKECTNKKCTSKRKRKAGYFYAEQFLALTLPGCAIGLDITLYIGFQMHLKNRSLDEVHKYLLQQGCQLDRSTVFRHYERYLKFMTELSDQEIAEIKKKMKRNAGYMLAIDAVHSVDSPLLLVCRDTLTKKVLRAKLILTENDTDTTQFLVDVKEIYGDPLAIVSDMGHGIRKGIETVFPDVKHQYCHFHFLKNLGKELFEEEYQNIQQTTNNFKKKMKKLALNCQKKVEEALNCLEYETIQEDKQALISLQEGLTICIAKVPSDQGFPFNLPAVNYVSKLVLSRSFLNKAFEYFKLNNAEVSLCYLIQELEQALIDFLSSGILEHVREIKVLNTNYIKLRKILDDEDTSSRQIKEKLALFYRQLKKHQIKHPKLNVIPKRIRKYYNNLFHCYDDIRIPRTNLEIERSFNSLKRTVRKRTGVQNRKTFFSHEGKALVIIENLTLDYKYDISETKFINDFQSKRLLVNCEKLEKQTIIRQNDKTFLKVNYQRKISVQEAGLKFIELKAQFKLI